RARLRLNGFGVGESQWFSQALRTIFPGAWSSREVKSVDVVRAILFDHRDDVLPQAGEQRRDADRRHHADYDSEHREKTAKLVPAHAIERHLQYFAQGAFWESKLHRSLGRVRQGQNWIESRRFEGRIDACHHAGDG